MGQTAGAREDGQAQVLAIKHAEQKRDLFVFGLVPVNVSFECKSHLVVEGRSISDMCADQEPHAVQERCSGRGISELHVHGLRLKAKFLRNLSPPVERLKLFREIKTLSRQTLEIQQFVRFPP